MLPKSQRLNLKKDFKWVAAGKKLETKYLKLFIKIGDPSTSSGPKIGITPSNKVFKKAHERNKARRLASAALQTTYYQLPSTINILALPKVSILGVKSGDVLLDLGEVLKKEKIIL